MGDVAQRRIGSNPNPSRIQTDPGATKQLEPSLLSVGQGNLAVRDPHAPLSPEMQLWEAHCLHLDGLAIQKPFQIINPRNEWRGHWTVNEEILLGVLPHGPIWIALIDPKGQISQRQLFQSCFPKGQADIPIPDWKGIDPRDIQARHQDYTYKPNYGRA